MLLDGISDGADAGKAISDHDDVCPANDIDEDDEDED